VAEVSLQAEARSDTGKGVARKLRAAGKVPAVMYGRGAEPASLAVDARSLSQALATDSGVNVLIDLHVDGEAHLAMARQLDRHPVRGDIRHVDFLLIDRTKKIAVDVPIHIEGDSPGIKEGGVLEHHLWQLHLESLPGQVPERINVDIGRLAIGDVIRVEDVPVPEGVTMLTAGDEIIVTCVIPQVMKVEEEVAEVAEGEEVAAAEGGEAPAEAPSAEEGGQEG
jgi:large subunit ribosomal protein L25